MKKLKNYTKIQTGDGSYTLFSKQFDEACHSTSGAVKETITHYINGCEIEKFCAKYSEVNVLEVGFGTGIGFLETLCLTSDRNTFLNFISFEIDPELIEYFLNEQKIHFIKNKFSYFAESSQYKLIILYGDARSTIHKLESIFAKKVHAIYQDAFSPKRNASLWTTEWFRDLKSLAAGDVIMSTYSASSSIRKSMVNAGWYLTKGEEFGTKRTSTRANLIGPSDSEILEHLDKSPVGAITDNNYKDYNIEATHEKNKNM